MIVAWFEIILSTLDRSFKILQILNLANALKFFFAAPRNIFLNASKTHCWFTSRRVNSRNKFSVAIIGSGKKLTNL